jgi:hypothetical protein
MAFIANPRKPSGYIRVVFDIPQQSENDFYGVGIRVKAASEKEAVEVAKPIFLARFPELDVEALDIDCREEHI